MNAPARSLLNKKRKPVGLQQPLPHRPDQTAWTMSGALLPASLMAVHYFGIPAALVVFSSIAAALLSEVLMQWALRKPVSLMDGQAFLTGFFLGLCLPSTTPFFVPVVGSFTAIVFAKHLLGLRGYAVFNPALFGVVVVLLLFPSSTTGFVAPSTTFMAADAESMEPPLALLKREGMGRLLELYQTKEDLYIDLFLGNRPGALGETSVAALLLGGLFLLKRRIFSWHLPVSFLAAVGVLAWLFGGKEGLMSGDPLIHLMAGGVVLGAFFLVTGQGAIPSAQSAQALFGIACGALTLFVRLKTSMYDGVFISILVMNFCAGVFDPVARRSLSDSAKKARLKKRSS